MARLILQFLGAFQATVNGQPAGGFRSNRARALLAYLAVESSRAHARAGLAADFWPDLPEADGLHNLRQTLVRLRQALRDDQADPPHLLITRQDVRFNPQSDYTLDVADFDAQIAAAGPQLAGLGVTLLENAVALYQGEFLHGFSLPDSYAFDEWQLLRREQLHRRALEALYSLATWHLDQGEPARALVYARQQLALDAWREEAHRQTMLALAWSGQRSAALAQYEACCKILATELKVSPETETAALYEAIKAGEIGPRTGASFPSPQSPQTGLPAPLTPFIGRDAELEHLLRLLRAPAYRLITLLGEGGMGKTRLALAIAERLVADFPDGVWFVPLADVAENVPAESVLVTAVAAAIGLTLTGKGLPAAQLSNALHSRRLLLILDNFESLLASENGPASVDLVLQFLRQAPGLKLLVTSRERLNVQAEYLYRLKGLPVPAPDDPQAHTFGSVRLFAERAERAWHEFVLDAVTLPGVIEICRLLEGVPLGIELSAAYADQMAAGEIAGAIQRDLDFLSSAQRDLPPRHRSLRAAFEGSWRVLSPDEQDGLAACTIFVGGFGLAAASAVTGSSAAMFQALLDRSLLHQAVPGRYELHAFVRQFAAQKLAGQAAAEYRLRHADYYTRYVEQRANDLRGSRQQSALQQMAEEIENIRHVWHTAAPADLCRLLRLADGLERFYVQRGWYAEGLQAFSSSIPAGMQAGGLQAAFEQALSAQAHTGVVADLLVRRARFDYLLGRFESARQYLEACLPIASAAGDDVLHGRCLHQLSSIASDLGDLAGALEQAYTALALFERAGDEEWIANALTNIGRTLAVQGQYAQADEAYRRGLSMRRTLAAPSGLADSLNNLGLLALRTGDYAAAEQYLREALQYEEEMDDQPGTANILSNLGLAHLEQQRYPEARTCFQKALAIQACIGDREAIGILQNNLGDVANLLGEYAAAVEHLEASLAIKREMNNRRGQTFSLVHLGHARFGLGETECAWLCYRDALQIAHDIALPPLILAALVGLAQVLAAGGQPQAALALLHHPLHHPAGWQRIRNEALNLVTVLQQALSNDEMDAVQAQARATPLEEVVAGALQYCLTEFS
ncbi:MAG: AfsR/SARP family transcriptional regulator [Chloroflexota bacterium]